MTTLYIGFSADFESTTQVSIRMDFPLAEHEHIWVWDHYYSLIMNRLSDPQAADTLLDSLSTWASGFATKMYSPVNELHAEGALKIDKALRIDGEIEACEDVFVIETEAQPGSWPLVRVKLADEAPNNRLAYSVIALASYFLTKNPLFFRELPLHILAMRKYYQGEGDRCDSASISAAPAYAMDTAMRFFNDMNKKAGTPPANA